MKAMFVAMFVLCSQVAFAVERAPVVVLGEVASKSAFRTADGELTLVELKLSGDKAGTIRVLLPEPEASVTVGDKLTLNLEVAAAAQLEDFMEGGKMAGLALVAEAPQSQLASAR